MAKRHSISKEQLISKYGDIVIRSENGGAMLDCFGAQMHPDVIVVGDYNMRKPNSKLVISGSIRNLVENGTLESVYVSCAKTIFSTDHVTYLWTSVEDHPWKETLSEEL